MKGNSTSQYFWITAVYFLLGFVNITLALSALACMILPFAMAAKTGKKTWCRGYCPRADFLKLFSRISKRKAMPLWMRGVNIRNGILTYFCMNLMLILFSTYMVSQGQMAPIERVRLFIAFELPFAMPQMFPIPGVSDTLLHFSYRMYSVMISSTILGLILSLLYKPATWCAVCPVSTMTDRMLKHSKPAKN